MVIIGSESQCLGLVNFKKNLLNQVDQYMGWIIKGIFSGEK